MARKWIALVHYFSAGYRHQVHTKAGALFPAEVLDGALATKNVTCGHAARPQSGSTVCQAAAMNWSASQESRAFSGLSLVVVAGMGRRNAGQTSKADHNAGRETNHPRRVSPGNGMRESWASWYQEYSSQT